MARTPLPLLPLLLAACLAPAAVAAQSCPGGSFLLSSDPFICQQVQTCSAGGLVEPSTPTRDAVCAGDLPLAGQPGARSLLSSDTGNGQGGSSGGGGGGGIALGPIVGCAVAGVALIVLAVLLARRRQKRVAHRDPYADGGSSGGRGQAEHDGDLDRAKREHGDRAFQRATMTSADRLVRAPRRGEGKGEGEAGWEWWQWEKEGKGEGEEEREREMGKKKVQPKRRLCSLSSFFLCPRCSFSPLSPLLLARPCGSAVTA